MTTLRANLGTLAGAIDLSEPSTFLIACFINLERAEDVIEIRAFKRGQAVINFLNLLDRPDASEVVVGLHLALPPCLNLEDGWQVTSIVDFTRITEQNTKGVRDIYAYRTSSGRVFTDGEEVLVENIKSERSVYQASNADGGSDPELEEYQATTAEFLSRLVNEIYKSS